MLLLAGRCKAIYQSQNRADSPRQWSGCARWLPTIPMLLLVCRPRSRLHKLSSSKSVVDAEGSQTSPCLFLIHRNVCRYFSVPQLKYAAAAESASRWASEAQRLLPSERTLTCCLCAGSTESTL